MLRIMRVVGILVFALLVGISAHSLSRMYSTGELFERYNSSRKTNITLLSFSVIGMGILGFFEISRSKRDVQRFGYQRDSADEKESVDGLDSTNIYAAPTKAVDEWKSRSSHAHRPKSRSKKNEEPEFWFGFLKILCCALPVIYSLLLMRLAFKGRNGDVELAWLLSGFLLFLLIISIAVAYGVVKRKKWSLFLGYVLTVFNLLFFPVGTAIGLLLLMGLSASVQSIAPVQSRRSSGYRTGRSPRTA